MVFLRSILIVAFFGITSCETLSSLPTFGTPVSESEAGLGIRQALGQGVSTAVVNLNREDGFFKNEFLKVLLPPDAQKVEATLRRVGFGREVDRAILQINRAAEDAVGYAKPIFSEAISEMSISDALNIVRGDSNAATNYFRVKTRDKLIAAFSPSVKQSLDKLGATKYYSDIVQLYNNIPLVQKANPDLLSYVVGKTTDALFIQIEQEERNIRANPVARTTEILKKVFGSTGIRYPGL